MTQPPTSATALRRAIDDAAAHRSVAPRRLHYTVASTVVLQILAAVEDLDYPAIAAIGPRLFAYRQRHEWPPTVIAHDGWDGLYSSACEDIVNDKVLPAVADAVELVNSIIERAVGSTR